MMRLDLTGRKVLVTGAARGIGAGITAAFLDGGVRGQSPRPIEEVGDADWMAIYDANVMSALLGADRHHILGRGAEAQPDRHPVLLLGQAWVGRTG